MASTDSLPLIPNNFDSDSGAESDVPGSVAQKHQQKMDEINFARSNVRKSLPKQSDRSALLHSQSRNQDEYEYRSPKKSPTFQSSFEASKVEPLVNSAANNETYPPMTSEAYRRQPGGGSTSGYRQERTNFGDGDRDHQMTSNISVASRVSTGSTDSLGKHKRSRSDGGAEYYKQSQGYNIKKAIELEEDVSVFCEPISEKLLCMLCNKVYKEPVITNCGHTFCRQCVISSPSETCPSDGTHLAVVVANIAVREQVGELFVQCKYGCSPSSSGVPGEFEINPNGCPETMKFNMRREHELNCQYAPVQCPNSSLCPLLIKNDLNRHLVQCQHTRCPHARFNCKFEGTSEEVTTHLESCKFEAMKEFLEHSENQMTELKTIIRRKEQESEFFRGVITKLTEKMERLEKSVEIRIDLLDENLTKLSSDFIETRRTLGHIEKELSTMDSRSFNLGAFDVQSVLKCKGTFVGHQGPVCSLCVFSSLLFSGSSDNSIKVWDTRSNYTCIKTFSEHTGMVLTLCAYRGKLYSGSADCTIGVFDIENMSLIQNFQADENPICTLAVGNGMLFSGSLKSIKVWSLESLKFISTVGPMNHWVRALCTTENFLYCGSYQTIKIWDLKTLEQVRVIQTQGGSVYSLVVSSDYIIVGTYENCIHIWDKKTYKSVARLKGHVGTVYSLVLMTLGDSSRVISASYDGSLRVWSLDNMQCAQTLFRHQGSVTTLAVSRGRLFSGSVDSTVKVRYENNYTLKYSQYNINKTQ